MKKIIVYIVPLLLTACYCNNYKNVPPAPVEEQTVAAEPKSNTEQTTPQNKSIITPADAPTSVVVSPSSQKQSANVVTTSSTAKEVKTLVQTESKQPTSTPAATPAQELVAATRAKQTLSKPQADVTSFKKEETLSTEGRLLNPFIYEPIRPDTTQAKWRNENLQYGIYYSFVKAGTAYIKNRGLTTVNGKTAYLIQTTAFSASVIDSVYRVRDINYSWIDANTFRSLGYSQSLREGNYKRDEWAIFAPQHNRFYGEIQKKKEARAFSGTLTQEVLDMLSSLYFVRAQPLEVGKDITFDIINREKQYPLVVKVLGKETVKTAAGKFNCWVVEPQFRGEGIFVAKGKSLKVWLTDDQYRMPVKMSVEVFIGSVYAELLAYTRD